MKSMKRETEQMLLAAAIEKGFRNRIIVEDPSVYLRKTAASNQYRADALGMAAAALAHGPGKAFRGYVESEIGDFDRFFSTNFRYRLELVQWVDDMHIRGASALEIAAKLRTGNVKPGPLIKSSSSGRRRARTGLRPYPGPKSRQSRVVLEAAEAGPVEEDQTLDPGF